MAVKPGVQIEIPGFGSRHITTVVSDYTGTHSFDGRVHADIKEKLRALVAEVDLHIITADSFGTARKELEGIVDPYILRTDKHDVEKEKYVLNFDVPHVAAFGNGNNDRLMLKAVRDARGLAIELTTERGVRLTR